MSSFAHTFTPATIPNIPAYLDYGRTSHSQQALVAVEAYLQRDGHPSSALGTSAHLPAATFLGKLLSYIW